LDCVAFRVSTIVVRPETTTSSARPPILSPKSRRTFAPAVTSTSFCTWVSKPDIATLTRYVPRGSAWKSKNPVAFVVVERTSCAPADSAVTVAPGIAPPPWSCT
jgi:hypothetical protein